jgi:release factor glutamine methyltransferase
MIATVMNRTDDVWNWFNRELAGYYPEREAHAIAAEVFKRLFGLPPDKRVLKAGEAFSGPMLYKVQWALSALLEGIPVQYVTGVCSFLDAEIGVEKGVLVPRPETEELVLWATSCLSGRKNNTGEGLTILDAGTGSGCIAVSLAKRFPSASILACDISPAALYVAKNNAKKNQTEVSFFLLDLLDHAQAGPPGLQLDCLISNPPYVREMEKAEMAPNVLDHEPHEALFVPDQDPLIFYRAITERAMAWLRPGGLLFYEINEAMGDKVVQLLEKKCFGNIILKNDFRNRPRFVRALKTLC